MMSQRKKKESKDKSSESSLGATVAAGAAVVGAAALAYGAWKLYDFLSSSSSSSSSIQAVSLNAEMTGAKTATESSDEEENVLPQVRRRANNCAENSCPLNATNSNNSPLTAEISLATQLMTYYHNYVEVQPNEMRNAMKVIKAIKMQVMPCLLRNEKLKDLHICELEETGSSIDGLMVVVPEEFNILIPFKLNTDGCQIISCDATTDFFSVSLETNDDAWSCVSDENKFLMPAKFINLLKKDLENAVDASMNESFTVTVCETSLHVDVFYGVKKVTINFTPALKIGERVFVVAPSSFMNEPKISYWRESFAVQERLVLNRMSVSGHKVILKIIKAIRLNFPLQFGLLSSYHYKTILFHLMDFQTDAADWETSAISERFIDFLIELGSCLKERNLLHYFNNQCNLLDQVSPEMCDNFAEFVNKIVGHHDISQLLKYDYPHS